MKAQSTDTSIHRRRAMMAARLGWRYRTFAAGRLSGMKGTDYDLPLLHDMNHTKRHSANCTALSTQFAPTQADVPDVQCAQGIE